MPPTTYGPWGESNIHPCWLASLGMFFFSSFFGMCACARAHAIIVSVSSLGIFSLIVTDFSGPGVAAKDASTSRGGNHTSVPRRQYQPSSTWSSVERPTAHGLQSRAGTEASRHLTSRRARRLSIREKCCPCVQTSGCSPETDPCGVDPAHPTRQQEPVVILPPERLHSREEFGRIVAEARLSACPGPPTTRGMGPLGGTDVVTPPWAHEVVVWLADRNGHPVSPWSSMVARGF